MGGSAAGRCTAPGAPTCLLRRVLVQAPLFPKCLSLIGESATRLCGHWPAPLVVRLVEPLAGDGVFGMWRPPFPCHHFFFALQLTVASWYLREARLASDFPRRGVFVSPQVAT